MTWHPEGIYFKEESWFIQGHSRMGNQSLSGRRQRVGALAERWRATITLHVPEAKRLDWRAWLAKRRGTMVPESIGPCRTDWVDLTPVLSNVNGVPFSGGATFSGGAGFAAGGGNPYLLQSASELSRRIEVACPLSSDRWTKGFFGIGGFLYEIADVISSNDDTAIIETNPPMRADYAAGTTFDAVPSTKMVLMDDQQGLVKKKAIQRDDPILELIEVGP